MKVIQDFSIIRTQRAEKGSSLIEVLIALFIMMVLMLGILQMFSVAYMENMGVAAKTEMTYKAQQFVENVRYLQAISLAGTAVVANTGVGFPLINSGGVQTIDPTVATYWNSANAGVVDAGAPYILRYSVTDTNPVSNMWAVTVMVDPVGARAGDVGSRYIGVGIKGKSVVFSAQIVKTLS